MLRQPLEIDHTSTSPAASILSSPAPSYPLLRHLILSCAILSSPAPSYPLLRHLLPSPTIPFFISLLILYYYMLVCSAQTLLQDPELLFIGNDVTSLRLKDVANALDLTAPASDILLKNRQNSWFQLSGHPDCFAPAGPGTIWKKRSGGQENAEREVYEELGSDPETQELVPRYFREVDYHGEKFIELQDLLHGFIDPHVMDVKMGTRTFLESEVQKTNAREDLYQKMVQVDPNAPTPEEHRQKAVTKLRYMQFREQQSSTCSRGFRIEAMKFRGSLPVTDLKKVKSREEVMATIALFLGGREDTKQRLLERLRDIRTKFERSSYFRRHEVVGSSIFMIYDDTKVGAWIIDFAKTHPLPNGMTVNHRQPWVQGNREDGFLFGLDSLISVKCSTVSIHRSPISESLSLGVTMNSLLPLEFRIYSLASMLQWPKAKVAKELAAAASLVD
uniref:Kinase n=1 Tax=Timema cristinae TaxID=61476 RepID=A0A7R9CU20_TIMCR|nr:unnamed protein product [Timema cristinae]